MTKIAVAVEYATAGISIPKLWTTIISMSIPWDGIVAGMQR